MNQPMIKYPARILLGCLLVYLACILPLKISLWFFPLPLQVLEKDYATLHLDSTDQLMRISLSPSDKYRIRLPLSEMADELKRGFLIFEDKYFYSHPGVNPVAIMRAWLVNARHGRVLMGGSTITMQIAKMMEPKPRTLPSKIIEVMRAFQLEGVYTKDELLELYLNLVPMGGNIEGVGAAAYLYFGKAAGQLSFAECSLLIGLPKSPCQFQPNKFPRAARQQRNKVMQRIAPDLNISAKQLSAAYSAPVPQQRFTNPYLCPQLIVRKRHQGPEFVKKYTIDSHLQSFCELQLKHTSEYNKKRDIHNGAILGIENRRMKVKGYIGSPDFNDDQFGGQVNGVNIGRSPGSLLKAFLYAAAIDGGYITPRTLVYDIEKNYDGYKPANYDRHFWGPLPAEDALVYSLNAPAVNLEYALASKGLTSFIKKTRLIGSRLEKANPGLSIVLGALPFTLEELVRLYSIFPNQGRLRRLCFFEAETNYHNRGKKIISPEASYIISEMLSKLLRPDLPQSWEFTWNRGKIAYKTGTSFGLRDAWAIGFTPDYTVGVWFGNVDAKGSSALVGAKVAAPLMAEIFNELTRYNDNWFEKPRGVSTRTVCALSGEPKGPYCPAGRTDLFIPGKSQNKKCQIHQRVYKERKTGYQVCQYCMAGKREEYTTEIVEVWPPEIASFLRQQGKTATTIPQHNPHCPAIARSKGLKIKSPLPGGSYVLTKALSLAEQRIPLQVHSQRKEPIVYWYRDDIFIGQGSPDKICFLDPLPGLHQITVVNSLGQFDSVKIRIQR